MVIYHIVVVIGVDISMKRRGVVDYMYLASIWTIRLFNSCCDICKDFRLETPAIHISDQKLYQIQILIRNQTNYV
jgi:hypothetical protein